MGHCRFSHPAAYHIFTFCVLDVAEEGMCKPADDEVLEVRYIK